MTQEKDSTQDQEWSMRQKRWDKALQATVTFADGTSVRFGAATAEDVERMGDELLKRSEHEFAASQAGMAAADAKRGGDVAAVEAAAKVYFEQKKLAAQYPLPPAAVSEFFDE